MEMLDTVAGHEVAHGVMRWLCGLPACGLWVADENGAGFCAGSGRAINAGDSLKVTLAGLAWEISGFPWVLSETKFEDLDKAREILTRCEHLRFRIAGDGKIAQLSVDDALCAWVDDVWSELVPHLDFIEGAAWKLAERRHLSGRAFGAMLREYGKRESQ